MAFTVACAQFAPEKAEVDKNLDTIAEVVVQAHGEGAELLVLPEACTSGYFLEGGVLEASLTRSQLVEALRNRLRGRPPNSSWRSSGIGNVPFPAACHGERGTGAPLPRKCRPANTSPLPISARPLKPETGRKLIPRQLLGKY